MKILIITKTLIKTDGQGRYSLGLIKELSRSHDLTILTSELTVDPLPANLKIIKIPDLLATNINNCRKYYFLVKKNLSGKDAVHFFTDLPNYLIFSPFIFKQKKPYFITAHGTFSIAYLGYGWRKIFLKMVFRQAKKVFCVSNFTKDEIYKRIELRNLIVINNGVDFERFDSFYQQIKDAVHKSRDKVLISVGAIKPRKGYEFALKAISILKNKYPRIKYYIIGCQENKNFLAKIKKIACEENILDSLIFLENISDNSLVRFYAQSDLLLFTPVNYEEIYFEGFGLVCLEAGVCEIPVVGSRDCGVEDAIKDGVTGYLVSQGEPEKIAAAVDKILSDSGLAGILGKNNREFSLSLKWDIQAQKYRQYYEN